MSYTQNETVVPRNVEDEMKESYLRYSMSVIISRALPDVRDGLKPSQRRILYAMRQLNLGPQGKHRKCAKICGDTSGDYHPHGETVIYPTLVRMSQEWMMRYQLVDGQGNFGSVDGDPPAAMRYTEARLRTAAMRLMEDLDKDTVDHIPNYDETKTEPVVFPAKFPNLLCNGSTGIAVGMATNIPPHNLVELVDAILLILDDPQTTIDEIMQVMPGPDFPTGGLICGYRGIKEAYHTGRGKLTLRALCVVEDMDSSGDRQRIIVDEIPYNVNKARLIEQIANLINNKEITGIADLRDESDKDGLRIAIELKRGEVSDVVLNQLFKYTDMQITFGCNMLALDKGLPRTMNIKQMMVAWVDHRIEVVRRRTRFELKKAEDRAHVLEGYLKAIDNLDEIVRIIRASPNRVDAKGDLVGSFEFSERQANAVLDLRLYQLTGMEQEKIDTEYKGLLDRIEHYRAILGDESLVHKIIKEELMELVKTHKSGRASQIIAAVEEGMSMEDLIANEPVIITISNDDYIKRMPTDTFREQRRGGHGVSGMHMKKEADVLKDLYVASTHDYLMIFTNMGRCYWLKVWQIPETGRRSKGKPIIQFLEDIREGEKVATVLRVSSFEAEGYILLGTKQGIVKKTLLEAFSNPRRKGVYAVTIDEGDEVIAARLVKSGEQVMLFTRNGMAVRFDESGVRPMGRTARGVKGVKLKNESDVVVGCVVVQPEQSILVVCERGFGKRSQVEEFRQTKRGGVGVRAIRTTERNGLVLGAVAATNDDGLLLMSEGGQTVRIPVDEIRIMGRDTQGVKLVNLKNGDLLVGMQRLEGIDDVVSETTGSEDPDGENPDTESEVLTEEVTAEEVTADEVLVEEAGKSEL
ncbi:MAG: DNA gyrase subunit A [Chlamydiales bacterium]|jgi:DNA gyrase subunit A